MTLAGRHVRLEPLSTDHVAALAAIGAEPELWRYTPTRVTSEAGMRAYVESALAERARGEALPFAIRDLASGELAGSTRFGAIALPHKRAEIGWTWLGRPWRRTALNTEAKLLLLTHGFEALGFNRIEFKTDALNAASRRALARIGAKEEGIFRRHMVMWDGRIRDTVYFSIVAEEWPAVKSRLEEMLKR